MRKNWKNKVVWYLLLWLPLVLAGCNKNEGQAGETRETQYTCPMHPEIIRDKPGSCPVCGMNLVARVSPAATAEPVASDLNYLLKPANQAVVSGIKTIRPVQKKVNQEIAMSGVVSYDTRRQYMIPARFGGRIEKLYVQFNYQPVRKGQKLYDIYSPELVTAQKEFLYLLKNDPTNTSLIQGARQKLALLGATAGQISQLSRTGRETYTFSVYSPYTGYVLDPALTAAPIVSPANASQPSGGDGMGTMGAGGRPGNPAGTNPAANPAGNGFAIREGMYVTTGQALFKVIDASRVWAQFNTGSAEASRLKAGTPVTITFNQMPGKTVAAAVLLVEPVYEAGENFARVRVSLPAQNQQALIGQLISGKVTLSSPAGGFWVPTEAVLNLGTQSVAFLKVNGVFKPSVVRVGERADNLVQVVSGLKAEDVLAGNAQFLVDSESFIRVAESKP